MEQDQNRPAAGMDDGASGEEGFREQDRFLPIANVYKVMRRAVPDNAKISKEAKELVQECVSEFISFITSEYEPAEFFFAKKIDLPLLSVERLLIEICGASFRASDKCIQGRRKTITGDDIISSMELLGFDNYVTPLTIYMNKFREVHSIDILLKHC
jgi:nuclear transcription Y subunit beta